MEAEVTLATPFPFGKYRGAPMASVLADGNYVSWLVQQQDFRDKYPNLLDYLANGSREGAEANQTPAHNAMQLRFLDPAHVQRFLEALECPKPDPIVKFEFRNWDVIVVGLDGIIGVELKPVISEDYPAVLRQVSNRVQSERLRKDPYTVRTPVVITDNFTSNTAELQQVKAMFATNRIKLFMWEPLLDAFI